MQVMLVRLMSKGEYLIVPKGTKFTGAGKLGLTVKRPSFISITCAPVFFPILSDFRCTLHFLSLEATEIT